MYDDPKSESYWKQIPKNPIFRKKYWSDKDLNVLYIWYWPDLANNRYSNDFTPEERKRIQQMWKMGLDKAAANLSNLPNPGDIGITGPSPWDDVFMLMPFSKYFVKGADCVAVLGKKLCSAAVEPVTKVVSQPAIVAAGKKASGYATKGRVGNAAAIKQYKIPNLSNIIRKYNPQDAIDDFIEIDIARNAPNLSKEALSATKRLYGYTTVLVEKVPQSEIFWSDVVAANGAGEYGAASDLRYILERMKVIDKKVSFAGQVDTISLRVDFPTLTGHYRKGEIASTIYHEIAHTLPKDINKYSKLAKNYLRRYSLRQSDKIMPISEMYSDAMGRRLSYELAGIGSDEGVYSGYESYDVVFTKSVSALAYDLFSGEVAAGRMTVQAAYDVTETRILRDMTRYGLKDGLDINFNNLARAKRIIGQNESFHDVLVNQIRCSPKDAQKAIDFINKLK